MILFDKNIIKFQKMKDVTHFVVADVKENGIKNGDFKKIPIQEILFDLGMKQFVKEHCDDKAKQLNIKILKRDNLPLNRSSTVHTDIQNKKPLDPIVVKKFKETKYYEVIQGRHRVVISLYEGFTHVPVIVS